MCKESDGYNIPSQWDENMEDMQESLVDNKRNELEIFFVF
jgi:hypothetical protein